jgi:hypothetical protein
MVLLSYVPIIHFSLCRMCRSSISSRVGKDGIEIFGGCAGLFCKFEFVYGVFVQVSKRRSASTAHAFLVYRR